MKQIRISDMSLRQLSDSGMTLTFKEKLEVAKLLDRLSLSSIEMGEMTSPKADSLLIKSVASSVENSILAVPCGLKEDSVKAAWDAVKGAKHPRLQVTAPMSAARMEYVEHMKADSLLKAISAAVTLARSLCEDVEFIAEDATRGDLPFVYAALQAAIAAGAATVTLADTAGTMLPEDAGRLVQDVRANVPELATVTLGISCSDALSMAEACCLSAVLAGADEIKVSALPEGFASLDSLARILAAKAAELDLGYSLQTTEIKRVLKAIEHLCFTDKDGRSPFDDGVRDHSDDLTLTASNTMEDVMLCVKKLGYELSAQDEVRVWNAFCRIAGRKKNVGMSELEAIIASEAMQVPALYTLENYVVTVGNSIDILAHVKLKKDGEDHSGLSLGDGPIDAAFLAIEKITGRHFELDDFQIQAITEGREAMGQTIVKLRSDGKVYSGRGISTDIIGSGIEAYVNALNKIVYEEESL